MSEEKSLNFIEQIIEEDIKSGKLDGAVHTRFPPEPNGYLHIGHVKAILISFDLAAKYGGTTNLRFDDTNPVAEEDEYVQAIKRDLKWLGCDWGEKTYYTSNYFDELYNYAVILIEKGLAYIDNTPPDEMKEQKGTPSIPGTLSPFRSRSIEENLSLFEAMKNGEFENGTCVLRAKIDMSSPNMHMRDPIMYRILHEAHHRTGDKWKIYPMYDFAHGQSDSLEHINYSLCSLEFENHRPLYNWFIENLDIYPSRQIEFARFNLNYTIMSKRKLLKLVQENHVIGWDDPRMPTISGLRRRGFPATAIKTFIRGVGVAKRENVIDVSLLEYRVREELNDMALRRMVVLDPLKVVITNFKEDQEELMPAENNPRDENAGSRILKLTREIFIEREDFMIDPPKKFFRMGPGRDTRLKHGFILHCDGYSLDEMGIITEVQCSYYPESRSGSDKSGIKAKGVLHWVSAKYAKPLEVRLYDRLFMDENPDGHEDKEFIEFLNPDSFSIAKNALMEPELSNATIEESYQFLRLGYFKMDPDSTPTKLVFNRTVKLKDSWGEGRGVKY